MLKTLLVLPDGTELSSGVRNTDNVKSASRTNSVNNGTELTLGSVCASVLDVKISVLDGSLSIAESSDITVYEVDDSENKTKIGLYRVEKPTRSSANTYKITSYDHIVKLDKDVSEWFNALDAWPYTLYDFAKLLCEECGLVLKNETLINGEHLIQKFSASGITGRRLMEYVGQVCCRFGRVTTDGQFEFAWYQTGKSITTSEFYLNSLTYEDYSTQLIERVQVRTTRNDVGTIYPQTGSNTYVIEGNPLLIAESAEDLQTVVQTIYEELSGITYTPCKCSLFYPSGVDVGDIVTITDRNGVSITTYVMSSVIEGQKQTIQCVGSYSRESVTFKNNENLDDLTGRVTEIEKTVEGLRVTVSQVQTEQDETTRKISELQVTADGLSSEVSKQTQEMENIRTDMTSIQQSADEISLKVQDIQDNGVSKVTNEFGLTINESDVTIHRSGSDMTNSLNETGMYVVRNKGQSNEQVMLKASADGVKATDVTVNNYLIIGHSRFEKYTRGTDTERTACFWV